MILVLVMVFRISVAIAVGFILGRIYQIRSELERHPGLTLPPPTPHALDRRLPGQVKFIGLGTPAAPTFVARNFSGLR
jgi:hypothetical protein